MRLFNREEVETAYNTNSKRGAAVFTTEAGLVKFDGSLFADDGLMVRRLRPALVVRGVAWRGQRCWGGSTRTGALSWWADACSLSPPPFPAHRPFPRRWLPVTVSVCALCSRPSLWLGCEARQATAPHPALRS
jgi:hypothetical protein